MKELGVEEKAKLYDKAITHARLLLKTIGNATLGNLVLKNEFKTMFPALEESEDERIRKLLIEAVIQVLQDQYCSNRGVSKEKVVAWLEKQGNNMGISEATKQKLEDNLNKALEKETPESFNEFLDEQGEQKPIDKYKEWYDFIRLFVKQRTDDYNLIPSRDDIHKWGDDILNHAIKVLEQNSTWSEEDKENLNWFEKFFRAESVIAEGKDIPQDRYLWFKNLKGRVQSQSHWKPSDEQIEALWNVYQGGKEQAELATLYNDLKKLRRVVWDSK